MMSHLEDSNEDFDEYFEGNVTDCLNESYDEKSDVEYCSPRFGEPEFSEKNSNIETDHEEELVIYEEDGLQFYSDIETTNEDLHKEVSNEPSENCGNVNENHLSHNIQEPESLKHRHNKPDILQKAPIKSKNEDDESPSRTDSNDLHSVDVFEPSLNRRKKSNMDENIGLNISNSSVESDVSYKELQLEVKSLLEASNRHQEMVHAELDQLLLENEGLKEEISRLNNILKSNELLLSQYRLHSLALNAQLPFLKSRSLMEEDKEELCFLRNKVEVLESKLKEREKELESADIHKEKAQFLENELERITKEFNELEIFQTKQLRIADDEIATLTEAKDTLFKEIHSLMKENEGLKLTRSVIKRIETYYKNINDEIVLPNIDEELNDAIKEFMENKDISDDHGMSSSAFEVCRSIIPRLAYEIAEEIVFRLDNNSLKPGEQMKKSLTKKNASIQVGFPLLNGSADSELNVISSRSELISLRSENCKLKKENQKLKQDLFLLKRISNRTKDRTKINCIDNTKSKPIDFLNENQQEESALSGIKWLTSVINEIDELEQRCGNIKSCQSKAGSRRSSAYNSTVASFEDINTSINSIPVKDETNIDQELIMLRGKLINEGILV